MKEAIAFQMEADDLWTIFLTAVEDANIKTEFLREVIAKATEKRNWNILQSDGMKMVEASFLEAWEEVETTAQETKSSDYENFLSAERRGFAVHLSPCTWLYTLVTFCTVSTALVY